MFLDDITPEGFVVEKNQLYDYDVNFKCDNFLIQDVCDVTNFRIETNSGDAAALSYVALIVNGIELKVIDNGETTFQVESQQKNVEYRKDYAVISKDYALNCGISGEPG